MQYTFFKLFKKGILFFNALFYLNREEMAKHYQIASILYDVLKTIMTSGKVDDEVLFIVSS